MIDWNNYWDELREIEQLKADQAYDDDMRRLAECPFGAPCTTCDGDCPDHVCEGSVT